MNSKAHWEQVYQTKSAHEVIWFQREARVSLDIIQQVAPDRTTSILDLGGGASTLVDGLLRAGYLDVAVPNLSSTALEQACRRLRGSSAQVKWLEADILTAALPKAGFEMKRRSMKSLVW